MPSKSSFRPQLEALEDRFLLSAASRLLGWEVSAGLITSEQALAVVNKYRASQAVLDFTKFDAAHGAGTFKMEIAYLKNVRGVAIPEPFIVTFAVTADDTGTDVARKFYDAVPKGTWEIDDSGGIYFTTGYWITPDTANPRKVVLREYFDARKQQPHNVTKPKDAGSAGAIPILTDGNGITFTEARVLAR